MKKITLLVFSSLLLIFSHTAFAATGDIGDTVTQTLEHDSVYSNEPEIVTLSDNYYALVYKGSSKGVLKTFYVSNDGATITQVDSWDYYTGNYADWPSIINIEGTDYYAIAYNDLNTFYGEMFTVQISDSGVITKSTVDTVTFDSSLGRYQDFVHVTGDYYALSYSGPLGNGIVKTYTISSLGDISNSPIDSLTFEPAITGTTMTRIINTSGDYYAIAYRGQDADGFLRTISIDSSGQISNSVIDTLEWDTTNSGDPVIIPISGTIFAITGGQTADIITVSIDSSGQINDTLVDSSTISGAGISDIIHIVDNVYMIASNNSIITIEIEDNGTLPVDTNDYIDNLQFDVPNTLRTRLIHVTGDTYAIAHNDSGNIGNMTSAAVDSTAINVPEYKTTILLAVLALGLFFIAFRGKKIVTGKA